MTKSIVNLFKKFQSSDIVRRAEHTAWQAGVGAFVAALSGAHGDVRAAIVVAVAAAASAVKTAVVSRPATPAPVAVEAPVPAPAAPAEPTSDAQVQ